MFKLTETEKAYIAGIVDGDGCITIYQHSAGGFVLYLSIGNTSKTLMEWLHNKLGRKYNRLADKGGKCKDIYYLNIIGFKAQSLISLIFPYLVIKTQQAEIALEFITEDPSEEKHLFYTEEEKLLQAISCVKIKELNKVGKVKEVPLATL